MVFTSHLFLFYFLPLVLAGYFALPARTSWRNGWLLATSYLFYGWLNPWFVALMLGVTAVTFAGGAAVANPTLRPERRRAALVGTVSLCLATLAFFKYAGFLQLNANHVLAALGARTFEVWNVFLPAGISFYIFHAITYVVDVHRGQARPTRSFADYACYIALFPQSIAGPIIRYNTIAHDLGERRHDTARFASGVALFMLGFAKKTLLANPAGTVADAAFGAAYPDAATAWFGLFAYALQIYFDFSGYSDMAVGLGRLFGFEFPRNFNAPYSADSITDFWRRWHISLSTFLRDYLYVPLGGNRRGEARTYANLAIVMLLGGLWHGANWTFLAWGAWHGAMLMAERWAGKRPLYQRLPRAFRVALTFTLLLGSWVWFRAENFGSAAAFFTALAGLASPDSALPLLHAQVFAPYGLAVLAAGTICLFAPVQAHDWSATVTWPKVALALPAFVLAIAAMFTQSANPFLYFQF